MSRAKLEDKFAALIGEIERLEAQPADTDAARGQLAALKIGLEELYRQTVAERDRFEQAESALRESENYNKTLFEQSHRPIVVFDPETGRFIHANQAAASIFGYASPEGVIGKTPLDMAAPTQYDGTDSATASRRRDQSALSQGIESFEWRHQRPNGEIWDGLVHLMAFSYRGRRLLQATLDDITERKRTEEALRQSRQLLESVLENSPAVIYAKRRDGRYTYINREWETVCDMPRDKVLGRTDHDVFPAEIADQFRSNDLAVLLSGKLAEFRGAGRNAVGRTALFVKESAADVGGRRSRGPLRHFDKHHRSAAERSDPPRSGHDAGARTGKQADERGCHHGFDCS